MRAQNYDESNLEIKKKIHASFIASKKEVTELKNKNKDDENDENDENEEASREMRNSSRRRGGN